MKKIPQRSCVVCRAQKNKNELLRIVKNKENIIKNEKENYIRGIYEAIQNNY